MAALTKTIPRFLTARGSRFGLAGFMQRLIGGLGVGQSGIMGTINIPSGSTSVVVTDTGVTAGDFYIVTPVTAGANACYFTGVTAVSAGASYTLNVNTDPGAGGVTLHVVRLPAGLLFGS